MRSDSRPRATGRARPRFRHPPPRRSDPCGARHGRPGALLDRAEIGGIYNIGGGEEIALLDAIGIIANQLGVQPTIQFEPARPGDQRRTCADILRAQAALDYRPRVGPDEGLRAQVKWQAALKAEASGA